MNVITNIFAAACKPGGSFFGMPTWYKYLGGESSPSASGIDPRISNIGCNPTISKLSDVWLVVAAVLEMLLRVASILAIGFIIYGGVRYIISQGEPDRLNSARSTIINALIGLVVSIAASVIISFIARQFIP